MYIVCTGIVHPIETLVGSSDPDKLNRLSVTGVQLTNQETEGEGEEQVGIKEGKEGKGYPNQITDRRENRE